MEETRRITIGRINEPGAYSIDWSMTSTSTVDELECERHVPWGGYAGLHFRLIRNIQPEISNSNGTTKITEDVTELAEWMDYRFWLDGLPSRTHFEHWAGIAMMAHPENERHPCPFIGYFQGNIHGLHAPILRDRKPLILETNQVKCTIKVIGSSVYHGTPTVKRLNDW